MIEIVKALDADVYNQLTPLLDTKGGAITALPAAIGHNTLPAGPSPDNLEFLLATAVRNINRRSSEILRHFSAVLQALKKPTYAGGYPFGKTRDVRRVQPDGSVRSARRKRAREEWTVVIEDHHEGYLTWSDYLAVEAKLAANNTQKNARPVRQGTALCQGIIFCGVCGGRVGTRYDRRDRKVAYSCQAKDSARTPQCRNFSATAVDDAVAALFLDTITPEQIGVAVAAAEEVAERHTRSHRAVELAVQQARYEADRAERAFSNVEPETVRWQGLWSRGGRPGSPR